MKSIKVRLMYRNYKPLHMAYDSLVKNPPKGVQYIVPKVVPRISRFMFIYRKYKHNPIVRRVLSFASDRVFARARDDEDVDMFQFVNMSTTDPNKLKKPYIVDVERATSLSGFSKGDEAIRAATDFLLHENCKAVVCWSKAARRSLEKLTADKWNDIKGKVHVIYPAVPLPKITDADHSIIKKSDTLKLLFVGNQSGRKGLPDMLEALKRVNRDHEGKVELYVISNDAQELIESYGLPNVQLFAPQYTKQEILEKFFLPADLFMFPTRGDTYGLAVIDSLVAGTPVVASRQFALPELIRDDENGVLITLEKPSLDEYLFIPKKVVQKINSNVVYKDVVDQLESVIVRFLEDRASIKRMSANTRKAFSGSQQFSLETRNKKYRAVYESILKS